MQLGVPPGSPTAPLQSRCRRAHPTTPRAPQHLPRRARSAVTTPRHRNGGLPGEDDAATTQKQASCLWVEKAHLRVSRSEPPLVTVASTRGGKMQGCRTLRTPGIGS